MKGITTPHGAGYLNLAIPALARKWNQQVGSAPLASFGNHSVTGFPSPTIHLLSCLPAGMHLQLLVQQHHIGIKTGGNGTLPLLQP